jgi:hypothetical protein
MTLRERREYFKSRFNRRNNFLDEKYAVKTGPWHFQKKGDVVWMTHLQQGGKVPIRLDKGDPKKAFKELCKGLQMVMGELEFN